MATWILVTSVVLVTGTAVIAALFRADSPVRHPGLRRDPQQPVRPDDLRAVSFPTSFRGYDPVAVERWLTAAADAWETLAHTAGSDVVALAEERLVDDGQVPPPVVDVERTSDRDAAPAGEGDAGDDAGLGGPLAWLDAEMSAETRDQD